MVSTLPGESFLDTHLPTPSSFILFVLEPGERRALGGSPSLSHGCGMIHSSNRGRRAGSGRSVRPLNNNYFLNNESQSVIEAGSPGRTADQRTVRALGSSVIEVLAPTSILRDRSQVGMLGRAYASR